MSYNPIVNTCIYLNTRRSLFNASAVFVVDVVLLLTMLLGLLRHAHKNSTGIWKFLYQQVTLYAFSRSASDAEFLQVYNLVGVSRNCRDTTRGMCLSRYWTIFGSPLQRFSFSWI